MSKIIMAAAHAPSVGADGFGTSDAHRRQTDGHVQPTGRNRGGGHRFAVRSRDRGNQGETKAKSLLGDCGQVERIGDRAGTAPGARRARPSRRDPVRARGPPLAVIGGILGVALGYR